MPGFVVVRWTKHGSRAGPLSEVYGSVLPDGQGREIVGLGFPDGKMCKLAVYSSADVAAVEAGKEGPNHTVEALDDLKFWVVGAYRNAPDPYRYKVFVQGRPYAEAWSALVRLTGAFVLVGMGGSVDISIYEGSLPGWLGDYMASAADKLLRKERP